jgi:hypothetical protein
VQGLLHEMKVYIQANKKKLVNLHYELYFKASQSSQLCTECNKENENMLCVSLLWRQKFQELASLADGDCCIR